MRRDTLICALACALFSAPSESDAQVGKLKLAPTYVVDDVDLTNGNATVGTLSQIPNDEGKTYTFSLVAGDDDDDNASFVIPNGSDKLKIRQGTMLTANSTYSVRVGVNDGSVDFSMPLVVTVFDKRNKVSLETIQTYLEIPTDQVLDQDFWMGNLAANFALYNSQKPESGPDAVLDQLRPVYSNSMSNETAKSLMLNMLNGDDYSDTVLYGKLTSTFGASDTQGLEGWVGFVDDWDIEVRSYHGPDYQRALGEAVNVVIPALAVAIQKAIAISRDPTSVASGGGSGSSTDPAFITPRIRRYLKHRDSRKAYYEHRARVYENRARAYSR
ncbi:MAG: hypothetical protein H8E66_23490 [Planctomycetes bacterium]|nr:hypothetical protein [Planctomycetota bacterium]